MTLENEENRFRERRSAHLDEDAPSEPAAAQAPPAPGPPTAPEVAPAREEQPAPEAVEASAPAEPEVDARSEPPAAAEPDPITEPDEDAEPPDEPIDLDEMARVEIPDPSFYEIVQPLEIQALQFLGELPLTAEGHRRILPRWAKHVIDLLGLLEQRTRGNLTPEEAQYLEQVRADLRRRYRRVAS